jgi:hypothetical protein
MIPRLLRLRCSPLCLAPALVGFAFVTLKSHSSYLFASPEPLAKMKLTTINADNRMFFVNCEDASNPNCTITP